MPEPKAPSRTSAEVEWTREWGDASGWQLRVGRSGERLVAAWSGLGTLSVARDGGDPVVRVADGVGATDERRWRDGALRALLRHLEGKPTLHASAVALSGWAFVFLGDSGAGKSTCAADLCARVSGELLADDLAELEFLGDHVRVRPSASEHWLLGDAAAALGHREPTRRKDPVPAGQVARAACPLGAIVRLAFDAEIDAPTLTELRGELAFTALNAAYARFIVDDPRVQLHDLDLLQRVAAAAPMYTLARPRSFAALGDIAALLTARAAQLPALAASERSA